MVCDLLYFYRKMTFYGIQHHDMFNTDLLVVFFSIDSVITYLDVMDFKLYIA